jgi:radical SAM superfamily enzyme YgiQ (UPF0313 family)
MHMIERIVSALPEVKTIIFQDDIFVFTRDRRVLPLCEAIIAAKERGRIPRQLQFISTNRIDAMSAERLTAMRRAGFRVLGFGIENFSQAVLREFNKVHIYEHIAPMLSCALELGITPFLDLILTSPHGGLNDLAETLREAHRWLREGCEIGMYPYVIPFSGSALARDRQLSMHTSYTRQRIAGTQIEWEQASKILPIDPAAREAILRIERDFETHLAELQRRAPHIPSRVRSLIWLQAALPTMAECGYPIADAGELHTQLQVWLPREGKTTGIGAVANA